MKTTQIFTYVFAVFLINNICTAQEKFTSESSEKSNCNIQNTTIEETIDGDNHKTLLAAVQATDIERLLDENIPFTIFAPSDHAFSKFSQSKLKEMLNSDDKNEFYYTDGGSGPFGIKSPNHPIGYKEGTKFRLKRK